MAQINSLFESSFGTEENGHSRPGSSPSEPKFYAERDEGFRITRLHLVWGFACATIRLMSYRYQGLWEGAITELEDRKGTLSVTWRDKESRLAFEGVILGAWEANAEHANTHRLATAP